MNKADAIIEVTVHYFTKGEKIDASYLESLFTLGGKAWDEATDEVPEAERGPTHNVIGQPIEDGRPDSVFKEDWIAFSFETVAEGGYDDVNVVEQEVEQIGWEEALEGCRDDLLKLLPPHNEKGNPVVKILTAWVLKSSGSSSCWGGDDSVECWLELVGRLDMRNVNLLTLEHIEKARQHKLEVPVEGELFS